MLKISLWAALLVLPVVTHAQVGKARAYLEIVFRAKGPKVGDTAPDFALEKATGGNLRASELWAQKPLVVTTGSYSCPQFRDVLPSQQALLKEFGDRVNFVVVYTLEAHPVGSSSPYVPREMVTVENHRNGILLLQPPTYEARMEGARECRKALHLQANVAVDTMDNATWRAYGSSPNCGYLIGKDGRIVLQQGLFDADAMRESLTKLLEAAKDNGNASRKVAVK